MTYSNLYKKNNFTYKAAHCVWRVGKDFVRFDEFRKDVEQMFERACG